MRTECSIDNPLMEAGSEEMEARGSQWRGRGLGGLSGWPGQRRRQEESTHGRNWGETSGLGQGFSLRGQTGGRRDEQA